MVIGPLLQPILNTSAAAVLNVINGAGTFRNAISGWINVNDVANAHIQEFERPTTSGRYCLAERVAHLSEVVRILCVQTTSLLRQHIRCPRGRRRAWVSNLFH